ncbi:hypothetical protein [Altererythrobacter sp. Root672]|nr:hypothetical protein [Altererythrobacter sp. Root672]
MTPAFTDRKQVSKVGRTASVVAAMAALVPANPKLLHRVQCG